MSTYQKVIIVGNVGKDPETRYSASGAAVCNFSLATSKQWKDKETGEKQEKTEWHRCVAFERTAEVIGEYVKKGSKVLVEGELQTRKYEKDGQDHYSTEIVVREMKMLSSKRDDEGGSERPAPRAAAKPASKPAPKQDDFDDDIPF